MFGRRMTFLLGVEGTDFLYNAKGKEVSAEAAYAKLTVPVFGKDVIYDVPNSVLMEQKKIMKPGFVLQALKTFVPLIESETLEYFKWLQFNFKEI